MGSGGGGSSRSTTQQTIAPELQGLFQQTGQQIQRLQGFSPFGFQGQFPGFFPGQTGGQPQVAQVPGLGTPTFAPAGLGTQVPAPAQGGLPGTPLDEFLFPRPQQIPGFNPAQFGILGRQQQRAFGPSIAPQETEAQRLAGGFGQLRGPEASALGLSTGFGGLRFPELAALGQIGQFAGGPIGSSPVTQAAIQAARAPVLNQLALAGLGTSGAVGTELAGAFAPILAQEVAIRAGVIPQLLGLGQQLRGGDINAASLQAQIGERLRAGDIQGANLLAQQGQTLDLRESRRLGEFGATAEQQRTLQQQQQEAIFNDFLRRQGIGNRLSTGLLGGFPAGLGQGAVTTTEGGGASK